MTITVTGPHIPAQRDSGHDQTATPESQRLAELQAEFAAAVHQLGQLNEALTDPQGWADRLEAEKAALVARMDGLRDDIRAAREAIRELTATSVLGA